MRATYLLDTVGPVRSRRGAHVELNKLSGTAVITGASSGIGAAYALELARRGLRPVLVARRQGLLEEVAARIHQVTGVTCEIWKADLSRRHQVEQAAVKLEAIPDLSMLVNNAGLGLVGKFDCTDAATHAGTLELHVVAPTLLSRAALPGMLMRGCGAIVFTASVAAFFWLPDNVNYCTTKAFDVMLADCLAQEVRGTGVAVQALCPGFVRTEFHDRLGPEWERIRRLPRSLWLSPEQVVAASLAGLERDRPLVVTGLPYRLLAALGRQPLLHPALRAATRIWHRRTACP